MPQLYARVFLQILDSSIADDWQTRFVFEDLLKLANRDGVVDMTRQAIARRTNVPLEIVSPAIDKLEAPDTNSRDKEHDGKRLIRLEDHRDWGWRIVNFMRYDAIRTQAEQREANAARMARYRAEKPNAKTPPQTPPEIQIQTQPHTHPHPHPQSITYKLPTSSLLVGYKAPQSGAQGEVGKVDKPKAPRAPRERNVAFDALVQSTGGDPAKITRSEGARVAVALRDIREACPGLEGDALADEIRRRAANYARRHPEWELTPTAVSTHWSTLDASSATRGPSGAKSATASNLDSLLRFVEKDSQA